METVQYAGRGVGWIAGLALSLACGCACAAPQGYVGAFRCDGPPLGLTLPSTYRALRKLAPIESEQLIDAEETDGADIERRFISFRGLELALILFADEPDRYMVEAAVVTTARWRITGPLHVGLSTDMVRQRLRLLHAYPDRALGFGSEGGNVTVKHAKGKVTEIAYSCFVG